MESDAIATVGNAKFGPKSREDVVMQPKARFLVETGFLGNGQERTGTAVAWSIDSDERYPKSFSWDSRGILGAAIKVVAIVSSTVECHD